MHRSKAFMANLGEDILGHMEKTDKNITPAQLTMIASMADDYNKLCKFIEKHSEHKMHRDGHDAMMSTATTKNPY